MWSYFWLEFQCNLNDFVFILTWYSCTTQNNKSATKIVTSVGWQHSRQFSGSGILSIYLILNKKYALFKFNLFLNRLILVIYTICTHPCMIKYLVSSHILVYLYSTVSKRDSQLRQKFELINLISVCYILPDTYGRFTDL